MNANDFKSSSSWINFQLALRNLETSIALPVEKARDISGIIKDFEMAYELSWKVLKKALRAAGHDTMGAKDVYTKAYQLSYLTEQEPWIKMIEDRNQTSHIYARSDAEQILERIKNIYLNQFQVLEAKLKTLKI